MEKTIATIPRIRDTETKLKNMILTLNSLHRDSVALDYQDDANAALRLWRGLVKLRNVDLTGLIEETKEIRNKLVTKKKRKA